MSDSSDEVVIAAAGAVAMTTAPASAELVGCSQRSNPDVLFAVAAALGDVGDARSIEALTRLLKNKESYVRTAAAIAIYKRCQTGICTTAIVPALTDALNQKDDIARGAIIGALQILKMGSP